MNIASINLLLAEDDADDCAFFKEALEELPVSSTLKTVNDGEQLMDLLTTNPEPFPDVLFLDLNMPGKNVFECLTEIKQNEKLESLPVIVYSTSFDQDIVNMLYEKGAHHFIRKPGEFAKLKKVILEALTNTSLNNLSKPGKENFVIKG